MIDSALTSLKTFAMLCFGIAIMAGSSLSVTAQVPDASAEWRDLFDGKTIEGWVQRGGEAKYEVIDGEIVGSTVPNTPNSFLCTKRTFTDFELQLDFKVHPELNSGIQIRSNSLEAYQNGRVHGYQIEIDPADRAWTGGIYDESRRGWLDDHRDNNAARYAFKQNDWNHFRIVAAGNRIRTWLNGVPAADLEDSLTNQGFIALQVHGVGARKDELTVHWKNIRIIENPKIEVDDELIFELIPEATAISFDDLRKLTESADAQVINNIENKSLTLMLLGSRHVEDLSDPAADEFSFGDDAVDPAELIQEIRRDGTGTMVQLDRIDDFTCRLEEHRATGYFSYEVPEMYRGKANYVAEQIDGNWQVTELSMPARGISLKRNAEGKWRIKPEVPVFVDLASIEKLAEGYKFAEGPALGPDGKIYFNDIPNQKTHVYDPATKRVSVFRENNGGSNGMFWTASGALISCEGKNRQVTRTWNGNSQILAKEYDGKKLNSPNDCVLDTVGGMYFTDPRYGNRDDLELDTEGVYYLSRDRKLVQVIDDLQQPNGIILSPDFRTLYVADFAAKKIWAYEVANDGNLKNKRLFAEIGSDGMSIDREGNVYLTWNGAIFVYSAGGKQIAELKTPEPPTNCLLVGDTLYFTAPSGFYSVRTNRLGVR